MQQVERLHSIDAFITVAVLLSQLAIGWFLYRNRRRYGVFFVALIPIWIAVGYGLWLAAVTTYRYRPPGPGWLHGIGTGTEIIWGMISTLGVLIYLIYQFLDSRLGHSPARRKLLKSGAIAAVAAPAAAIGFGAIIERRRFEVREVTFPVRNLSPGMVGMRIAHVSDFHVSPYLSVRDAGRVVGMTNELKPNLTVFTGDLITEIGDPLDAALGELAHLRADLGVLACHGNHEIYTHCMPYLTAEAAKVGIRFLRKETQEVHWGGGSLNIAGIDFQASKWREYYLYGCETLMSARMPNILLSHNPDVFARAAEQGWDGVLSGHTHGGQVTVEILEQTLNVARFFTPFVAGLYRIDRASCYVTRGIGTIGMPVRFGETPEITLLRLVQG